MENKFIEEGIRKSNLEDFLKKELESAGYSHSEIRRTPMGIKIKIHASKPGLIIGRGGRRIDKLTNKLEEKFGFEDPQLDVEEIEKPELNADIVVDEIKSAIERGANYKRVCNGLLRSIMERGAAGAEIRVSGKLSGSRGRTEKFMDGYLKSTGEPAKRLVDEAVAHAKTKPGTIGIKVRIMQRKPDMEKDEEEEEKEEGVSEEQIENILNKSIKDAKAHIDDLELGKDDMERILEAEREGKDRKGMKEYLEGKTEGDE